MGLASCIIGWSIFLGYTVVESSALESNQSVSTTIQTTKNYDAKSYNDSINSEVINKKKYKC
ncbi:hypothetical protein [Peptostreptococcus equinus]|uniref:hypothetical protein n=1 Tax=Peptostreptococcus equinus TaxID=3003601 RepID=UPI003BF4B3DE